MEAEPESKWNDMKEIENDADEEIVEEEEEEEDEEEEIEEIVSIDDGYKSDDYTKEIDNDFNDYFNILIPKKQIVINKNEVEWLNEEPYLE